MMMSELHKNKVAYRCGNQSGLQTCYTCVHRTVPRWHKRWTPGEIRIRKRETMVCIKRTAMRHKQGE